MKSYDLDIESADKTCSTAINNDRALMKKKVSKPGSVNIYKIDKTDIYNTYKNLYLSK